MIFTPLIKNAIRFATKTHEVYQKQKRKGKDIPYITHPLVAGLLLTRAGASEEVVAAGILHDTIEDSIPKKKVTREMLVERFGERIADLVVSVSEMRKDLPWEERKLETLEHIKSFSHDSLLVKSADTISNISELVDDHKKDGDEIFSRFNAPEPKKEKTLKNYLGVITLILQRWPETPFAEDLHSLATALRSISEQEEMVNSRVGRCARGSKECF